MRCFCLHQANPSCLHSQIVDFNLNLVDVNPPGNVIEFLACGLGVPPVLDLAVETNTDEGKDLFVRPDSKPMVFHMKAGHEKDRVRKNRFLLPLFKPLSTNKISSPEMLTFLMEVQQSLIMRAGERSGGGKRGRCHILCLTIHSKPSHQVNSLLRITFFLFLLSHFQNSNLKNIDLFLQVGCSKGGVT